MLKSKITNYIIFGGGRWARVIAKELIEVISQDEK